MGLKTIPYAASQSNAETARPKRVDNETSFSEIPEKDNEELAPEIRTRRQAISTKALIEILQALAPGSTWNISSDVAIELSLIEDDAVRLALLESVSEELPPEAILNISKSRDSKVLQALIVSIANNSPSKMDERYKNILMNIAENGDEPVLMELLQRLLICSGIPEIPEEVLSVIAEKATNIDTLIALTLREEMLSSGILRKIWEKGYEKCTPLSAKHHTIATKLASNHWDDLPRDLRAKLIGSIYSDDITRMIRETN